MTKLVSLIAIVSLSLSAGCKKKDASSEAPAAKTTDDKAAPAAGAGSAAPTPTPAPAAGSAAAAVDTAPNAGSAMPPGVPQECKDYMAAVEKLSKCDKLPQAARDAMKQGVDSLMMGFTVDAKLSQKQTADTVQACKDGLADSAKTGKDLCGW